MALVDLGDAMHPLDAPVLAYKWSVGCRAKRDLGP